MPKILCAGLIAADMVFEVSPFPEEGKKHRASASHLIGGGGALIAASAIAALGGDVSLIGAVGQDAFGAFLRDKMDERHIDSTGVVDVPGVPTSRSTILLSANGERTIINHRDAALALGDFDLPDVFPYDAALVDTRWPQGAAKIVQAAKRAGKPAVIDAEAPVKIAEQALKYASHIVFSEQGLTDFAGSNDAQALKDVAADTGAWCAVTRGALPVLCCDGQKTWEIATPRARVLNTLGAGDAWHGAFTLALAQGFGEHDAVRRANAAASFKVRFPIQAEAFASLAETDAVMAEVDG